MNLGGKLVHSSFVKLMSHMDKKQMPVIQYTSDKRNDGKAGVGD